jgi:putative ABC transport system permease protein
VEGRAETEPKLIAQGRSVEPSYFATMRIPLLAGEMCRNAETASAMVNRSFANQYFGGSAVIGRHITLPTNAYTPPTVVRGIVGDARENGLDHEPVPTLYWCFGSYQPGTYFLARVHGRPEAMTESVRRKIHELEPRRSVFGLVPLSTLISDAYAENRLRTILLIFFAVTAVSLACVGLYGTLSYLVKLRQREVGLRLALGAMRVQIVRQFLVQGLLVTLAGCVAGLALGALTERFLAGMLYGVSPSDAGTLGGVVGMVIAVSAMASLIPAVRAARLEPMEVLREE